MMTEVQVALDQYKGAKVTIMGLGVHGGGAGATRFFAGLGADVTVTDLKGKRALASAHRTWSLPTTIAVTRPRRSGSVKVSTR